MDFQELGLIAFRASVVYLLLLVIVRILGKREIGSFSAFDFIVALILGESVDEAIYGDVTLLKFAVLVVTIAAWHYFNSWISFKSPRMNRLLESQPDLLVEHGKICHEALAKERMGQDDLFAQLRLQSIEDIKEVKQAFLEASGHVSVIKEDWAKEIQKSDLPSRSEGKKKAAGTPHAA